MNSRAGLMGLRNGVLASVVFAAAILPAGAQTVHVDVTASHALAFDPDRAMGTSMDILPTKDLEKVYSEPIIKAGLSAGWGPITYRQNTELTYSAWHWNPNGKWSDEKHKSGYFVGSAEPTGALRESFGYHIEHRGTTRSDAGQNEYSRITDGNPASYWKSNPYLASKFTGEPDSALPQWVLVDFGTPQQIDAIQIAWANPFAKKYAVEYWTGKEDALNKQTAGTWVRFPNGEVNAGTGGSQVQRLADQPVTTRFLRIWMTESSNTCDIHGGEDVRNCVGYAIKEISAGNFNALGEFVDLVKHTPGQAQTVTQASSVDSWHTADDIIRSRVQTGFDLFFQSGYTNHLPAMIPIAMLYANPEDSVAELSYIEKRGYAVSYVEMGEEPDGAFMQPEDYAALYLQWAAALHKVDPKLKLGGPIFTGVNEDIKVWPDAQGRTSWLGRFIDYLKAHGRMSDLAFVSFEHYPLEPCAINWSDLYREPELVQGILKVWRDDGVPADVPLMNTESNVSWSLTDPMQDLFAGLWLADSVGAFLEYGGPGAVYYHSPIQPEPLRPGCHAWSTYGNFVADDKLEIKHHTAQYFAGQLLNLDWVKHGAGTHHLFGAVGDLQDEAKHNLITAYAVKRPDGEWSLLIINKDPSNAHEVRISFESEGHATAARFTGPLRMATFGAGEYVWHPAGGASHADPAGPAKRSTVELKDGQTVKLPKASVTVLTGKVTGI
jgi:F5/8 type C domain-containing protein/glycosyl hydrolase family 39 (putative alpha-L-iduronidase)